MDNKAMRALEAHSFKILCTLLTVIGGVFWTFGQDWSARLDSAETEIVIDNERERYDKEQSRKTEESQREIRHTLKVLTDRLPEEFPPAITTMQIRMNTEKLKTQETRMDRFGDKLDSISEGQGAIIKAINDISD